MHFRYLFITSLVSGVLATANVNKHNGELSSRALGPASSLDKAIDPSNTNSLCRLSHAQSARVGDRFYTAGGDAWFTSAGTNGPPFNGTNRRIFWFDLSKSFTQQNYEVDSASIPIGPNGIEILSGASLFPNADGSTLTQFGGTFDSYNTSDEGAIQNYALAVSIGIQSYRQVSTFDLKNYHWNGSQAFINNNEKLEQPADGASVSTPAGNSYHLNGHLPAFGFVIPVPGLVIYNGTSGSYANETTSFGTRIRGNLVHIPIDEQGVLLSFAGEAYSHNDQQGETDSGKALVDMNTVKIYDIASHKWYDQLTTPDTNANNSSTAGVTGPGFPAGRVRPCSVVATASDNSSYNIYMFGGTERDNTDPSAARTPYSEVWVLSIPSFKWILVDSGNKALFSMTCTIDGGQAFLLSGATTVKSGGTGDCTDAFSVFDLSGLKWSKDFAAQTNYTVPSIVSKAIGGGPNGGATLKTPANGWSDPDLATMFNPTTTSSNITSTASGSTSATPTAAAGPKSSSTNHTNLIAGLVVGGAVLLSVCLLILRYHRQRLFKGNKQFKENGDVPAELGTGGQHADFQKHPYNGSQAELGGTALHEAHSDSPTDSGFHEVHGDSVPTVPEKTVHEAP